MTAVDVGAIMADRSIDVAITVVLVVLSWALLWTIRSSLSRQEFRFGVAVLLLVTVGFVVGRIVEWRTR